MIEAIASYTPVVALCDPAAVSDPAARWRHVAANLISGQSGSGDKRVHAGEDPRWPGSHMLMWIVKPVEPRPIRVDRVNRRASA